MISTVLEKMIFGGPPASFQGCIGRISMSDPVHLNYSVVAFIYLRCKPVDQLEIELYSMTHAS